MDFSRRELICGTVSLGLLSSHDAKAREIQRITPEQFGARGDGRTNDTDAFAAMAAFVNQMGGGTVELRATTYLVGRQFPNVTQGYSFAPAKIMEFSKCSMPLLIRGNGAKLLCAGGLRYGTFNARTGRSISHPMPYYGSDRDLASPYARMIGIEECAGPVEITDLELDGNVQGLQIGGPYGDADWQIGAVGIQLVNNRGTERLARIRSHHHALDGVVLNGSQDRSGSGVIEDVVCEFNGRQGCSIVGGRSYSFQRCRFNHTGKAGLASAPGAGVDIEAEGGAIRNLSFVDCEFSNNRSAGLLADSGDSEGAHFEGCKFIGTTGWAAWPRKPGFRFHRCEFVGSIVAFGDPDPERAAQFHDCTFRDDPALSPTGEVYNAAEAHPIAELPYSKNVLFNRCRFHLTHAAVLPWSTNGVIYSDCIMSQTSSKQAYPRGTFIGRNRIDGNVDLYSSNVRGELILNGKLVPVTQ